MSTETLRESVISGAFWAGIERWASQILSFSIYVLLARLVGPTSYGLIALASVYLGLIEVFMNQGFGTALVQRKDLQNEHLDSVFWVNLAIASVLAVGSIVLANSLATLFGEVQLAPVIQWLAISSVLASLETVPRAILVRNMGFRALSVRSLSGLLAGGIVGISMAWFDFGVWSLVGQQLANLLVGTAAVWWVVPWRPSWRISKSHLRDVYGFSMSLLGTDLLWYGAQRIDQTLIGYVFGASALGPYALAARSIALVRDLVTGPVQMVALPALSTLQEEWERLRNAFYSFTELVTAVVVPAFFGIAALAPSFVPIVFGDQWVSAVPLFQVLAVYAIVCVPLSFCHPLMIASGRPGVYLVLSTFQTALTLGFCLIATHWSPVAIGGALSLATVVHAVMFLVVCQKMTGISIRILMGRVWAPTITSCLMFGVVYVFQSLAKELLGGIVTVVSGVFLGVAIYCLGMALLRPQLIRQIAQDIGQRFGQKPLKPTGET